MSDQDCRKSEGEGEGNEGATKEKMQLEVVEVVQTENALKTCSEL